MSGALTIGVKCSSRGWLIRICIAVLGMAVLYFSVDLARRSKASRQAAEDINRVLSVVLAIIDYDRTYERIPVNEPNDGWRKKICGGNKKLMTSLFCDRSTTNSLSCSSRIVSLEGAGTAFDQSSVRRFETLPFDLLLLLGRVNIAINPDESADVPASLLENNSDTLGSILGSSDSIIIVFADTSVWLVNSQMPANVLAPYTTIYKEVRPSRERVLAPWLIARVK